MPIISPYQPIIPGGEGHGQAVVLPQYNNHLAELADFVVAQRKKRDAEASAVDETLLNLGLNKGNMLTKHGEQFDKKVADFRQWIAEQRAGGSDIFKSGTPEYNERNRRLMELNLLANKGKLAKDWVMDIRRRALMGEDKFDPGSLVETISGIEATPLEGIDSEKFGIPEAAFDLNEYSQKLIKSAPIKKQWDYLHAAPSNIKGYYEIPGNQVQDISPSIAMGLADPSKKGERFREVLLNRFASRSPEEQKAIQDKLTQGKGGNASLLLPENRPLLQKAILGYEANNLLSPMAQSGPLKPITLADLEYRQGVRNQEKEQGINRVVYDKRTLAANDPEYSFLSPENKGTEVVNLQIPKEGENKPYRFTAHGLHFKDESGGRGTVSKAGSIAINGVPIEVVKTVGKNGEKQAWVAVEGVGPTNADLYPEKYKEALRTPVTDPRYADAKPLIAESKKSPRMVYYVPMKDAQSNMQTILKKHASHKEGDKDREDFRKSMKEFLDIDVGGDSGGGSPVNNNGRIDYRPGGRNKTSSISGFFGPDPLGLRKRAEETT